MFMSLFRLFFHENALLQCSCDGLEFKAGFDKSLIFKTPKTSWAVYCQFSTVANNVGVRIWDAKPDHYLGLFNGQFRFSENLMYEKKFAKVTFAESLLWSVYNFPNYLLCNKKYSCRLQLCLTNTEFLPSRITVSLFFGKTFTMEVRSGRRSMLLHQIIESSTPYTNN